MPSLVFTLLLFSVIPYWNALSNGFTFDDFPIVVNNAVIRNLNIRVIFLNDYWETGFTEGLGVYRPLTVASYAVERLLCGLNPAAFHGTNLALHALVTSGLFGR